MRNKFLILIFFIALNQLVAWTKECSSSPDNIDYMGMMSRTKSNQKCIYWTDILRFYQGLFSLNFVDSIDDARNFCRNPKGSEYKERAWCFTNIETKSWEYCDIPQCLGCSKIHGISYGSLELYNQSYYPDESFRPGTLIKFSCNPNFAVYDRFSGSLTWTCKEDGQWSASKLPQCQWRGFGYPDIIPNCWYYSLNEFYDNLKPRRLYYGTTSQSKNRIRCLSWSNAAQYSDKDFPQEGKLSAQNFCRSPDNYEPYCLINNYSDVASCEVPKCNGCAAIPYIKYTSFSLTRFKNLGEDTLKDGSELKLSCSAGTLIGQSILRCKNGTWDNQLPKCSVKYCSMPPQIPNGEVKYRKIFYANIEDYGKEYLTFDDSIYLIECAQSYEFDDPNVTQLVYQCKSGEWILNSNYANCIPKSEPEPTNQYCQEPQVIIENGYRKSSSIKKAGPGQYYGEFELDCNVGFKLSGNPVVSCVNGSWSSYPVCIKETSCSLDIINTPAINVKIISSSLFYNSDNTGISVGSYVKYECLPNTVPELSNEDLTVTCLENGQWSSKIPVKCILN